MTMTIRQRMDAAIAAQDAIRGRPLTEVEKMTNLFNALDEEASRDQNAMAAWCAVKPRKAAVRMILLEDALAALIWDIENQAGDPHTLRHAKQDLERTDVQ